MGWELRHGRRYLYRNRRVGGRPVKEYLAADDPLGFGELMAHDLAHLQKREQTARGLRRKVREAARERIDGVLSDAAAANAGLRVVAEAILYAVGFRRHNRGEWRMRREMKNLAGMIDRLKDQLAKPGPVVNYSAPAGDAEVVELFARARAGDEDAQAKVRGLVVSRGWGDWLGDLGRQATRQLIGRATAWDPVWEAGVTEKANALRAQLLGDSPSVLDELLVRRVVNGWVAVHALELELTVRPPLDPGSREHLDRALTRAQKRYAEAIRELARVRRLQAPRVLAQLNVVANQAVVNSTTTG